MDLQLSKTPGAPEGLGHIWSLSVEAHFYLIWPPLLVLLLRSRRIGAAIAAAGVLGAASIVVLAQAAPSAIFPWTYYSTWGRSGGLMMGCIVALVATTSVAGRGAVGARWLGLVALGIAPLWTATGHTYPEVEQRLCSVGIPLAAFGAALIIYGLVTDHAGGSVLERILSWRWLTWFGSWSYSLYLVQLPVVLVVLYHWGLSGHLASAAAIVVAMAAGYALHLAAERPALRWSHSLRSAKEHHAAALGLGSVVIVVVPAVIALAAPGSILR
jgi:peptidoglycan/LPS O-acetylase OafA/YrhL